MHLLRIESRSIDALAQAVDLSQTPADIVVLSFSDTDLAVVAAAWEAQKNVLPSLRLANLSALRHPYSVDLYIEKVLSRARFILVRLLGGKDYWRYGVDQLAMLARASGIHLAIVPGDHREDTQLDEAATLPQHRLRQIEAHFVAGGVGNIGQMLHLIATGFSPKLSSVLPSFTDAFGLFELATRPGGSDAPLALVVFYRSLMQAADCDPVIALATELAAHGFRVTAVFVTSLKDPAAFVPLHTLLAADSPDIILNLTAFSARLDAGGSVLDRADVPVLQLALCGSSYVQWATSQRGMGPADLAMNVVLPEIDGRIIVGAISFKGETRRNYALEYTRLSHQADQSGIRYAAGLATAWVKLARTPRANRRIACVVSDYPAKAGRTGYAVGLDTQSSIVTIAAALAHEGYTVDLPYDVAALAAELSHGDMNAEMSIIEYARLLTTLPGGFVGSVSEAWGEPHDDADVESSSFRFRFVRAGNLLIAVQPHRGNTTTHKTEYHDALLPPRHGYVAFYLWLRMVEQVHAIIHCGTHGTLEWLPGKAVALSEDCAPRAILGAMPLIYPFIVNNPGEAAQAKRRIAAVTVGHLTPPLTTASSHGAALELEHLFDEYTEAQSMDPRRAALLSDLIIARAHETGLAAESGIGRDADETEALIQLDAWLCELKNMQIGDGLHVFGQSPDAERRAETARSIASASSLADSETIARLIGACGAAEMRGLLAALDGRMVPGGPAGSPVRGRLDVLPTGRNLYSVDPRAIPTRTAWGIGQRTADAILIRHAQDHGEWPARIVLDVWGSATMRTGGDDLAQAFALLGVQPRWDSGSNRIAGFDILPLAVLNRPRIDVTLRISGLFRDVFPEQIALFDEIVREVAALDEAPEDNPLAASVKVGCGDLGRRIFGVAPGAYGIGLSNTLSAGDWKDSNTLGQVYLQATTHAYGAGSDGIPAEAEFRSRVANADAFVHVQDLPGQDVLDADAYAEHEGGFAAAAAALGNHPALYHGDTTMVAALTIRTVREEVARVLRARAVNPRWLAGQMRHGFRGAAEIAETVDNFFAFAALTHVTEDYQFDLLFGATIGDEAVRNFLIGANPAAANAIAERFDEAIRRGLWTTRRNAAGSIVDIVQLASNLRAR